MTSRSPASNAASRIGYTRFNAALGESQSFVTADWVDGQEITRWLTALPQTANSGTFMLPWLTASGACGEACLAIVALIAAGYALTLLIFYPGIMTFDAKFVYEDIARACW